MNDKASQNNRLEDRSRYAAAAPSAPFHEPLAALLARGGLNTPDLFVQQIFPAAGIAALVRMNRQAYRAASFLDTRLTTSTPERFELAHDQLMAWTQAITDPPRPLHFIFHSGHVGSTLISRLVEEARGVLSLREPATLRTLASMFDDALSSSPSSQTFDNPFDGAYESAFDSALATQVRLWRRGYGDTAAVVVKATSDTARLAERLMREAPKARAVLLNAAAEIYVAQTLSSPMRDLKAKAPERLNRLSHLLGAPAPAPASRGEMAAMSWLAESMTHKRIAEACAERVLNLDFDAFLADPNQHLRAIFQHLSIAATDALLKGVNEHVLMGRYSKDPAQAYSALDRSERLRRSRQDNAEEIRRGLNWLDATAGAHPEAAEALAA